MANKVKICDCTLRDGGYVNDWDFGHSVITGTYKRLDEAGVDYIEVGFLDDRRAFDINRSIMPNTDAINKVFANVEKKHAIPVAMIDYGTCSIESIGQCEDTFIDGIRVIFKKEKIAEALPFCKAIKEKGYKLFIQAISITAYSDEEMLAYVKQINEIKPYAFSIVDTYGLLDNKSLTRYFYLIDNNLDPEIKLGYHEHNNFQLGFSNTIKFLSMETERELVADSTVYGMGKSAGNCATELLAMHLNDYYHRTLDLNLILEIIDTDLLYIYQQHYWGYKYDFYISAMQKCHPTYVKTLLDKKTLSITAVNEILASIPEPKKLHYDKEWIEKAYISYQSNKVDDTQCYQELKAEEIAGRTILVVGPGSSIDVQKEEIQRFISEKKALVILTNFYTESIPANYMFMSNAKRYSKLSDVLAGAKINTRLMLTSNVSVLDYPADFVFNYDALLNPNCQNSDNVLMLLLAILHKLDVKEVYLAGFDGFGNSTGDYCERGYEFERKEAEERNRIMSQDLNYWNTKIKVHFVTPTRYVVEG